MAVDLTKFCTSNAADGAGYASPTNFYADDGSYSTAAPNKNNTLAHYVSGFDFSAIGNGDTLNSVTVYIQFKYSTDTASYTLGSQGYVGATAKGSEYTNTNTPANDTDVNYTITGLTIADIKSADFKIRVRCSRGNTNTGSTQSIDYVKVTVNYTAVVVATGTLSKTLDNTSLSASGKAIISGSLSKSIDVISISAAGEVSGESEPEEVTGVLDKTIDSVSLSSSGKVTVQGAVGKTLDGATLSSAGKVIVNGALSKSLDSVVVASAGKTFIAGELSKALDGTQIQSAGKVFISGALETNIDAIALNAVGRVDDEEPTITEGAIQAGERGSAIADSRAVMGAKANGGLSGHRKVIEVKHGN